MSLYDDGFYDIVQFAAYSGNPKSVSAPCSVNLNCIYTLCYNGTDFDLICHEFPRTYLKKHPPEVGDKGAPFATKQDEFFSQTVTKYTDGQINTNAYGDEDAYRYNREPRGDVDVS